MSEPRLPGLRPMTVACLLLLPAALNAAGPFIDAQSFKPAPAGSGFLAALGGGVLPPGELDAGLLLHYQDLPLTWRDTAGRRAVVSRQLTAELLLAYGFAGWFDLGLAFPVVVHQAGEGLPGGDPPAAAGIGDVRLVPRFRLVNLADGAFSLALVPQLGLPTGRLTDTFTGARGVAFWPTVALGSAFSRLRLALDLYGRLTEDETAFEPDVGDELGLRFGIGVAVAAGVELLGELQGATAAADPFGSRYRSPFEGLLSVRWRPIDRLTFTAGGGAAINRGYNAPRFRAFAGVGYAFDLSGGRNDDDGDGIAGPADRCPDRAEDPDGFEENDGCPDPDNDRDGMLDVSDGCPDQPEDRDGFEDDDGCPDPDNDQDGIPDGSDPCPGIPEDVDGFEDSDGCPDTDNDQDGISDRADRCPDRRETVNLFEDDDGCPDEPPRYTAIVVSEERIDLLQKLHFTPGSSRIEPRSFPLLDEVAAALRSAPAARVRIEGHTDASGRPEANLALSEARADSVKAYLVEQGGIDPARLEAVGCGQERPLADNASREGRERNRRVEFILLPATAE